MPSFKDALNRDQVRAIQSYVLSRAAASVKPSDTPAAGRAPLSR